MIPTHLRLGGASVWHPTHGLATSTTSQACGKRHQNLFFSAVQSHAFLCKIFAFLVLINFFPGQDERKLWKADPEEIAKWDF